MAPPASHQPAPSLVGGYLRNAREVRQIGLRRLADMIGILPQLLSAWEKGTRVPETTTVARILGYLRVDRADYEQILHLARHIDDADLVDHSTLPTVDLSWKYDQLCSRVVEWAPFCVPALLQTPEWAETTAGHHLLRPDRLASRGLHLRVRQEAMTDGCRRYVFLIGDGAMRRFPDGDARVIDQIEHLRAMARHRHVSIRIVPSTVAALHSVGAFTLHERGTDPIAVSLRHTYCTTYLTSRSVLSSYHATAKALVRRAFDDFRPVDAPPSHTW
jgi:transcriptional regulator with XRE-family HTH domain